MTVKLFTMCLGTDNTAHNTTKVWMHGSACDDNMYTLHPANSELEHFKHVGH